MDDCCRVFVDIFLQLKRYGKATELTLGLAQCFAFYHGERPHLSLANRTPNAVYADGHGGGASISDHFGGTATRQCRSAAIEAMDTA